MLKCGTFGAAAWIAGSSPAMTIARSLAPQDDGKRSKSQSIGFAVLAAMAAPVFGGEALFLGL
jgi:hypothetical protein